MLLLSLNLDAPQELTLPPPIVTVPLPSRSGIQRGGVGRPNSTEVNTLGIVAGASAHAVLSQRVVSATTYLEATASGQHVLLGLSSLTDRIPDPARVLFVRVRVRARSVGSGAGTLRIAPLTALDDNDVVTQDLAIATGPMAEYTALFHAQQVVDGEYAAWDLDALEGLRLRLESVHASNHVRLFSAEILAFHLPVATLANFLSGDIADLGWVSEGNLGAGSDRGVAQLLDDSDGCVLYSRGVPALMPELGDAVAQIDVPGAWATFDGVFGFNVLTVDRGDRHIAVNALFHGGSRKLGLLLGPPGTYDPTLISSYAATYIFDWQERTTTLLVAWDGSDVRVYVDDDPDPVLEVAETALAAGVPGIWGGPHLAFGTGWDAASDSPSEGEVLYLSVLFRGRQEPDGTAVVADYRQLQELAPSAGFETTRLLWHAGAAFDAFKIRFGGVSHDSGFYISTAGGSQNTEGSGAVAADEVVESIISVYDLLRNDSAADGDLRELRIYVRDASTGQWSTLLAGALEVPVQLFRRPPALSVADFIENTSQAVLLSAGREFRVEPEVTALPPGASQAMDLSFEGADGLLTSTDPLFEPHQDSFPGIATQVAFPPIDDVPLDTDGTGLLKLRVIDAHGLEELQLLQLTVRNATPFTGECDANFRKAFPPITLQKGGDLEPWLRVWDRILCRWRDIAESMQDLIDVRTAPAEALRFKFAEASLTYPSVPGFPDAALRRLLLRARRIHGTRFSLKGLRFYLESLIPNADVEITGFFGGLFIFCDAPGLGLPDADQINTSGTPDDSCPHLFGPLEQPTITITITGVVSEALQEFLRATIRDELPMADDPVTPRAIEMIFIEP